MLNITLCIQIAHFWVAYYILDVVFLRRAVEFVRADDCALGLLQQDIDFHTQDLTTKAACKSQEWIAFQQQLKKQYPSVHVSAPPSREQEIARPSLPNHKDIERAVLEMAQLILTRITQA